mmetsp:Transcript_26423/g.79238  ORF Transcript_26423/g.79238 Transcript_26423/m.79238 type:complete len:402 (+) Transcript_26423:229-1434(+)
MAGIFTNLVNCLQRKPAADAPYLGGPSLRVGVLGGGQLGRMMMQEAVDLDARIEVLDPSADAPCRHLTHRFVQGDFRDADTVEAFGKGLDCITIEIEDVSVEGLERLEAAGVRVVPKPAHVGLIQDKGLQKQFFLARGIPTAKFSLQPAGGDAGARGYPIVQKLRRGGYDGKGVKVLADARAAGFEGACVLEDKVDISKELSVVVCRRSATERVAYAPTECVFDPRGNVVRFVVAPAAVADAVKAEATALALRVADEMGFVGILAIEMFLDTAGRLLVNEVAPRAHNSGHHTIEQCATSQFGQLLRATLDLPLGDVAPVRAAAAMVNILGDADVPKGARPVYRGLRGALAAPGVHPHLYGKSTVSPFRKMGHVTVVGDSYEAVVAKANELHESVGVAGVAA